MVICTSLTVTATPPPTLTVSDPFNVSYAKESTFGTVHGVELDACTQPDTLNGVPIWAFFDVTVTNGTGVGTYVDIEVDFSLDGLGLISRLISPVLSNGTTRVWCKLHNLGGSPYTYTTGTWGKMSIFLTNPRAA